MPSPSAPCMGTCLSTENFYWRACAILVGCPSCHHQGLIQVPPIDGDNSYSQIPFLSINQPFQSTEALDSPLVEISSSWTLATWKAYLITVLYWRSYLFVIGQRKQNNEKAALSAPHSSITYVTRRLAPSTLEPSFQDRCSHQAQMKTNTAIHQIQNIHYYPQRKICITTTFN